MAGSCWDARASGPCETTWEAVREVDPEQLFLMPCGFDAAADASPNGSGRRDRPGSPSCAPYAEGELFALDGSAYFSRPGPRVIDGIELLAELFDPDGFVDEAPPDGWIPLAV